MEIIVKSEEPLAKSGVETWSWVSLFAKFQVNGPSDEGEQSIGPSFTLPDPVEVNV